MPNKKIYDAKSELNHCGFVKTVLMILVVFYHSILYFSGTWFDKSPVYQSDILATLAAWLNSFHIYAFVLVSGYLFYFLKMEQGKYENYFPFITNKAKRLLVPFAFVCCAWAIPWQWLFLRLSLREILEKYIFGTSPSQLWFLLMLFLVFVIFHPLSDFLKNHTIYGALLVGMFYALGVLIARFLPNIFQIFTAFRYLPFFFLGFKIRQYGSEMLRKIPGIVWILVHCGVFVLTQYVSKFDGIIFSLMSLCLDFVLHIIGAIMAFVVLQKLAQMLPSGENKIIATLGKISMPVYLFHQQIIYVIIYLLNGWLHPVLHAAINFVFSMLLSCLISMLFMKFKWTRKLIGEK